MKRRIPGWILVAGALLSMAACDSPTEPDDPFVGTWSGTLTDASGGAGTLQLVIEARAVDYGGTWSASVGSTLL